MKLFLKYPSILTILIIVIIVFSLPREFREILLFTLLPILSLYSIIFKTNNREYSKWNYLFIVFSIITSISVFISHKNATEYTKTLHTLNSSLNYKNNEISVIPRDGLVVMDNKIYRFYDNDLIKENDIEIIKKFEKDLFDEEFGQTYYIKICDGDIPTELKLNYIGYYK